MNYLAGYEPASIEEAKALQFALDYHYNVSLEEEVTLSNFNKTFYLVEHRPSGSFSTNYRLILSNRRDGIAPYKNLSVFLQAVRQIAQKSFPGSLYALAEHVAQEVRETYHAAMQYRTAIENSVSQGLPGSQGHSCTIGELEQLVAHFEYEQILVQNRLKRKYK